MMDDQYKKIWDGFSSERSKASIGTYPGLYRAQIIETNDPLRMHRVQFLCPELHDSDLKFGEWASPSFQLGGKGAGSWASPCIGDQIFLSFEKGHEYGPVWVGAADPTRRKFYPRPSIFGQTPLSVNLDGDPDQKSPKDFLKDYVPKDERPMSTGIQDRYGSTIFMSSVGFFPVEHRKTPLPTGTDAIAKDEYKSSSKNPIKNDPDLKMLAAITKYGTHQVMSDIGYNWDSEFIGNFDDDFDFEVARNKYFTKLVAGNKPKDNDRRGWFVTTMLGHKIEMRDVGWNDSRDHEFDDQEVGYTYRSVKLSNTDKDERWLKLRTKGGHFDEFIDIGFDPKDDVYTKRFLIDEVDSLEDEKAISDTSGGDARMMRRQTRYGYKFIMDDRGSDKTNATEHETPRGQGIFAKGRRNNRGFFFGFNEQDELNAYMATSPTGSTLEINDKYEYVGLSDISKEPLSAKRTGHFGVEWFNNSLVGLEFETSSNHLKLDRHNKYVRFKTTNLQGVEFRDRGGPGNAWAEMRDEDDRGLWMNTDEAYSVWRSKDGSQVVILDDGKNVTVIRDTKGVIQISAEKNVEITTSLDLVVKAGRKISMKASDQFVVDVAGTHLVVRPGYVGTNEQLQGRTLAGRHTQIEIPAHPNGPAAEAPMSGNSIEPTPVILPSLRPGGEGFDRALTAE